jgi:hypothetical protein
LIAGHAVGIHRCVARGFGLTTGGAEFEEALDAIGDCIVLEKRFQAVDTVQRDAMDDRAERFVRHFR